MKTWRKEFSLLLVGLMIMSGLVAISAPASADYVIREDFLELDFDATHMVDDAPSPYTERTYFADADSGNFFHVGSSGNNIRLTVNSLSANVADLWLNLTGGFQGSFAFDEDLPASRSLGNGVGSFNADWTFDILITDFLGYGDRTRMSFRYWYVDTSSAEARTGTFDAWISISSLFQRAADGDTHTVLSDLVKDEEHGAWVDDGLFEAGDTFVNTVLNIENNAGSGVDDLRVTLTPPTGITLVGADDDGRAHAWLPDGIADDDDENLFFRSNVESGLAPGRYIGTALLEYVRDDSGLTVTEPIHDVIWPVNFNFRNTDAGMGNEYSFEQCYATNVVIVEDESRQVDYVAPYDIPTIEQDTYTDRLITVEVTIVNNGNHPLYNVEFELDTDHGGEWDYFRNPRFFWETAGDDIDSVSDTYDELAVGDEITFTIEMIVVKEIPIGEHRLPILYRGYYFNDGSLDEATGFFEINDGEDLEVLISIFVTDDVIDCRVHNVEFPDAGGEKEDSIVANEITLSIENLEAYNFIHVMVQANFTDTPWYNPIIGMRGPLVWAEEANEVNKVDLWEGGDDMELSFIVDTDPNMEPDRYPFRLEVTAVIEQTLEVVTVTLDYRHGAVVDFGGYGPRIQISAFANTDMVPGKTWEMTLTIENVGDDTLRDVSVFVPTDDTVEYEWDDLYEDFFDYYDYSNMFENWGAEAGGQVHWTDSEFPEDIFYTMEKLDVDNMREIVEINLYTEGVYSTPGARISLIRINDLAPGASFDVDFEMFADKDMVNGKPYTITVTVFGIDSLGAGDYVDGEDFTISVMSSLPGKTYNPVELNWFDAGLKALALFLFFIIVLAILLFVYNMFKGEPYDEDDEDFAFEDDEPFEPEPTIEPESPESLEPPEKPPEVPEKPPEQELVEP